MTQKKFQTIKIAIIILITIIVSTAVSIENFFLALAGILIGSLFMFLVRKKYKKVTVDERVISVSGQAARLTYNIVTFFLACSGIALIIINNDSQDIYGQSLGILLSYISILMIAVYSLSFYYLNKKHAQD